jgi:hypothetical protein
MNKKQKWKIREMEKSLMTVKNLAPIQKLNPMEVTSKLMEVTLISHMKNTYLMKYEHEEHQCG